MTTPAGVELQAAAVGLGGAEVRTTVLLGIVEVIRVLRIADGVGVGVGVGLGLGLGLDVAKPPGGVPSHMTQ